MKSISVIVPVYNCEKYIARCIESIICQDYEDYELIMIDDASIDSSPKIIEKYAIGCERIKYFRNPQNAGAAAARNRGIEVSQGELICFVDGDDFLSRDYFSKVDSLFTDDVTLLSFDYMIENKKDKGVDKMVSFDANSVTKEDFYSLIFEDLFYGGVVWNKVFRRDIIVNNAVSFPEGVQLGEDTCFCLKYLNRIEKGILVSEEAFYHYSINPDSTLSNESRERYLKYIPFVEELETYDKSGIIAGDREAFLRYITYLLVVSLIQIDFIFGIFDKEHILYVVRKIETYGGGSVCSPVIKILFMGLRFFPRIVFGAYRFFRLVRGKRICRIVVE